MSSTEATSSSEGDSPMSSTEATSSSEGDSPLKRQKMTQLIEKGQSSQASNPRTTPSQHALGQKQPLPPLPTEEWIRENTVSQLPVEIRHALFMKNKPSVAVEKKVDMEEFEDYDIMDPIYKMGWGGILDLESDICYDQAVIEWMSTLQRHGEGETLTLTSMDWIDRLQELFFTPLRIKDDMKPVAMVLWRVGIWNIFPRDRRYQKDVLVRDVSILYALISGKVAISYAHLALPRKDTSPESCIICVRGYNVKNSFAPILEAIFMRHGDIAAECTFETASLRPSFLEVVCEVVMQLQTSDDSTIISKIEEIERKVSEAEAAKIHVSWLRSQLEARKNPSLTMEMKAKTRMVKKASKMD
ncbi:hypothetical protein L1887_20041 [Cichorium endivia]|nr:hypothetical protein L1887_20041 [Cichorium endivia]